ncbi:histidine phosphatase family protein [Streptomyces sp. SID4985]|uniref:histidine phosphatase family protein n=1 Tax=unclassified Streptomyces TaxID=2593676 RepID=UPI00136C9093|nr:histidine phosphatase family protein [Streptomyces sp. SID4985]MYQ49126.1 histidine phosphatase family protein [Streptomyces sp. SID4985]
MARPRRIILVRHGESTGNVDDSVYEREPDHALALTERGRRQAEHTGERLREIVGDEPVSVYVSPYRRTHETLDSFHLDRARIRVREEPRLREQDWGNWQERDDVRLQKAYRDAYGHFFFRFPQGESGADVYDRVGGFLESLFRSFEEPDHPPNVLLVTHGLAMRLFCMRWFHWTVSEFESLSNPGNAEMRMLVLGENGKYALDRPFERWREPVPYWIGG